MAERRLQPDSVAWWGHATVEIDVGGTRLLTDPVLTRRVGHLVRRRGDNPPPEILSPDAVLISHLHADHTHLPSLRILEGGVQIVVPRGAPAHLRALRRLGNPLVEISVGDHVDIGTVRVTAVPAVHDGRRWRRGPHDVEAIGYLIEGSSVVYFAGDTAPFDAMSTLVPQCDLALLPVGGWGPTLGDGHMDPRAAALAADAVGARLAVPIHYGTLWPVGFGRIRPHLFDDPGDDFVAHAAALGVPATALAQTVRWPIKH